eukprot:TRINITY_DN1920_c0_g1_i7.p1 TRINITY_DN1920_c0_g1~~TRINITY_DN1920_c0_g1_i7.p1  ORF type:complete len:274 (+),score=29.74 TRINITY_DN1920_c0_g1_i7:37-858(+)
MQNLCQACIEVGVSFSNASHQERALRIIAYSVENALDMSIEIKDDIRRLLRDPQFKKMLQVNEFRFPESASYFLRAVDRTFKEDYVPCDQDILRSRSATTGLIQMSFLVEGQQFRIMDVGGQRSERNKWIHCFDNVTAVLFLSSLSEYDQTLFETGLRNRLMESLDLFDFIVNLPAFRHIPVVLFLTKRDVFERKIKLVELSRFFPFYTGPLHEPIEAIEFIQQNFLERCRNPAKQIFVHVTDATDTDQFPFLWRSVRLTILQQNLNRIGIMQ